MKFRYIAGCVFIANAMLISPAWAAGDAAKGKEFYAICAACHGDNAQGIKELNSPQLAGQFDWYIVRQLKNFKAGFRGADPKDEFGAQMRPMAMTLPDDQAVEDVVAYISTLPVTKPAATVNGDAAKGKTAYTICMACHGPNGEGNAALNSPRLANQQDWYMVRQIKNYKAGLRGTHADDTFGVQMRPMAMTLATDDAINDIAAYINTLE